MALKTVAVHELARNGYRPHPKVAGLPLAQIVEDFSDVSVGYFPNTPRWMVLPDEAAYRRDELGFDGDPAALDDAGKLAVLSRDFSLATAESGVGFAGSYRKFFEREMQPPLQEHTPLNVHGLKAGFEAYGVVQNCGARGAFSRLFNLVRLAPDASIAVENSPQGDKVTVTLNGDLMSICLFYCLISPHRFAKALEPRIFFGVDIGWDFSPHNLVVFGKMSSRGIPRGMHIYTVNITAVGPLLIADQENRPFELSRAQFVVSSGWLKDFADTIALL